MTGLGLGFNVVLTGKINIKKGGKIDKKVQNKRLYLKGVTVGYKVKNRIYSSRLSKNKKVITYECDYILVMNIPTPWGAYDIIERARVLSFKYSVKKKAHALKSYTI